MRHRASPAPTLRGRLAAASAFLGAAVLVIGGGGCAPEAPNRPAIPGHRATGTIAVIGAGQDDPRWPVIEATALRYGPLLGGFTVEAHTPAKTDAAAQIDLLAEVEKAKPRGVLIVPAVPSVLGPVLDALRNRGIVVVTLFDRVENPNPFLFAGVDEVAAGRYLADAMCDALGGEGNVLVLTAPDAAHLTDRALGLHNRLEDRPAIKVLREIDTQDNPFVAQRLLREYVERFPRLDGCIALDDWPLRGVPRDERILPPTCRMVTVRAVPSNWPRLVDGTCAALVTAPYDKIVEAGLRMCATAAQGQPVPATSYLADPLVITEANLQRYRASWYRSLELPPAP
jgi:ribose transport system substrate-binding protein